MLGKQWLTRYFRHTGKSMIERCGDRQRKFDGLDQGPFHLFLSSPPLMLQLALFLLACGLSRYMWSVNTSVARIIISFTTFGLLFYTGIVVAGISSYECPFQTPTSEALRYLRVGRALANARDWLVRRFRSGILAPHNAGDVAGQPPVLRLHVPDIKRVQQQNRDDAHCVSWVLRNITEPEAIDAAVRLAANIRWFGGDSTNNPPFDLIVPIFEACFDSTTKRLYPSMRDRAYFSAQAIFQIYMKARVNPHEDGLMYPNPTVSSRSVASTDHDLHHIIHMIETNPVRRGRPIFHLPNVLVHTPTYPLQLTNLFVDLTHKGQNPTLESYRFYCKAAAHNNTAVIADILLMWYMFLGGSVEEKVFWLVDKSYVIVSLSFFLYAYVAHISDSLETILSCLSTMVVDLIEQRHCPKHLHLLLNFLAAWESRPAWLTRMAYQWCSTLFEMAEKPNLSSQPQPLPQPVPRLPEKEFLQVGKDCDVFRSPNAPGSQQILPPQNYMELIPLILKIGFRNISKNGMSVLRLNHTLHHNCMFEAAFSTHDDRIIADALSVWIADKTSMPSGSVAQYLSKRVERATPFPPQLLEVSAKVIARIGQQELQKYGAEIKALWGKLLVIVTRSSPGSQDLPWNHWLLLDGLLTAIDVDVILEPLDVGVMKSLAAAEDWDGLEVWAVVVWKSIPAWRELSHTCMKNVEQATLKLLLNQPLTIPRFEALCGSLDEEYLRKWLQDICDGASEAQLNLAPPPLFVSYCLCCQVHL